MTACLDLMDPRVQSALPDHQVSQVSKVLKERPEHLEPRALSDSKDLVVRTDRPDNPESPAVKDPLVWEDLLVRRELWVTPAQLGPLDSLDPEDPRDLLDLLVPKAQREQVVTLVKMALKDKLARREALEALEMLVNLDHLAKLEAEEREAPLDPQEL